MDESCRTIKASSGVDVFVTEESEIIVKKAGSVRDQHAIVLRAHDIDTFIGNLSDAKTLALNQEGNSHPK